MSFEYIYLVAGKVEDSLGESMFLSRGFILDRTHERSLPVSVLFDFRFEIHAIWLGSKLRVSKLASSCS